MTTRQEFLKQTRWFPSVAHLRPQRTETPADKQPCDVPLATNGDLTSILSSMDRAALRKINISLTQLAIQQCCADGGAANIIDFGSMACVALAGFAAHEVLPEDLLALSRDHDVVFPWSLQYGNARTPFNLRLVRLPLLITFPRTVNAVAFWINFVRGHKFTVSIRSGNSSYEGLSTSNEVVIDLTYLVLQEREGDEVQFRVDTGKGFVDVASGVRLGVLYAELAKQKLALAGGQCAPVCVGGLVGTGGVGFLTRRFGFACDQLLEVEMVLADGSVVVANAVNEHADLYRAAKGAVVAGLGVMTRLRMKVVPVTPVLFYSVSFNLAEKDGSAKGARVTAAWQNGEYRVENCSVEDATRTLKEDTWKSFGSIHWASLLRALLRTLSRSSNWTMSYSIRQPPLPCLSRCRHSINGS